MPPGACAHCYGRRFGLVPSEEAFEGREPVCWRAHTGVAVVSLGRCAISVKAGNRRRAVNRAFNELVGESVDAQSVGNGGNRPTTHTGGTGSPTDEEMSALRVWEKQGEERAGQPSGPDCECDECRQRREPGALLAPGAE
jgi:hypothetical protein